MWRALWIVISIGCAKAPGPEPTPPAKPPAIKPADPPPADHCDDDIECRLTTWQEGCGCAPACIRYATTERALAARQAGESCPQGTPPPLCPPPAPCPSFGYQVVGSKCDNGKCTEVRRANRPPPPPPVIEEHVGEGACKKDRDCELSNWQLDGCGCLGTCDSYAISKKLLASRKAKERCPKRTRPCRSPSRCPDRKYNVLEAVCRKGECYERRELLPPKRKYFE